MLILCRNIVFLLIGVPVVESGLDVVKMAIVVVASETNTANM